MVLEPAKAPAAADGSDGLLRQIGLGSAIAIIIASMIGQAIFTTPGYLGHDLQHPGIVMGLWLLGGALSLAGALCYVELGTLLPRAGGEYAFLREAFGPLTGFLSGWACFLGGFSAPIALCALTFSEHAATFFPALHPRDGVVLSMPFGLGGMPLGNAVAAALILFFTCIHCYRVSSGLHVQNALTIIKAGLILLLAGAALASGRAVASRLIDAGTVPQGGDFLAQAAKGLVLVTLAYAGWNGATYMGSEVKDPRRTLPRATISGTLAVTALYLVMNAVYIMAVPVTRMEDAPNIALLAAQSYFGTIGGQTVSLVIALTQFATISAFIMTGSRVYFAMGEDGVAPRRLARVARAHTPRAAVLLQGGVAFLMTVYTDFRSLAEYSGVVLSLFSGLTVAGLLVLRWRRAREPGSFRAPLGPLLPLAYIAGTAWILFYFTSNKWNSAPLELAAGVLSILAGLPVYAYYAWSARVP